GRGDHLEGGSRWLWRRIGGPGHRENVSLARIQNHYPTRLPTQRAHGGLLQAGVDRGPDRLPGRALSRGQNPPGGVCRDVRKRGSVLDREELPTRLAGEAVVEGELKSAHPRVLIRRVSGGLELRLLRGVGGAGIARHVDR